MGGANPFLLMRNLLHFLTRNHFVLLFLALEIISLVLIVNYNNFQKVKFLNSSNGVSATIYKASDDLTSYVHLRKENEEMAKENAELRTYLQQYRNEKNFGVSDSVKIWGSKFLFRPAKVINNSVNKQYNYITLNQGKLDGIEPNMGIIGNNGIVGMVTNVSDHYSSGPSILNKRWKVSSRIKKNNYFGSLSWDGRDFEYAQLNEIPFHVDLTVGDTIISSGYSSIFPEGILIGTIESFNHDSGANFYKIKVKLSTNFKTLSHVEVIKNNFLEEQQKIEEANSND